MAACLSLGAVILYILTLAPTTQFWDASEYIAASHSLGIPHAPGNPFFILVAHVWGLLPLAADYGKRINILAAVTSAVTAGLWFLIAERLLRPIVAEATWRRVAALAGAIIGATVFTVWNQSVANEKVYTLSVLSIALVLWLTLRWGDQPSDGRRDNLLVLIVYLLALSATNHLMGLLAGPAVLAYVIMTDWRALIRPRFLVAAVLFAVVGLSVNLFIPVRAHLDPYMNQGGATNWPAFRAVMTREQFGKPSVFANPMYPPGPDNPGHTPVLYGQQLLNYVQYFSWQFGRDWSLAVQLILTLVFAFIGVAGARRQWRADRRGAITMIVLMVTLTFALVFYLNFKWGYSQRFSEPAGANLEHEVRERDYFFIASFAAFAVWIGMGLAALAQSRPLARGGWKLAAPVFLLALIPLIGNHLTASRAGETLARDYARDILRSVDPYAIVITSGDNDTFPLWHAQEVEGVRRDVSVMVLSLANLNWYLSQLQHRPAEPFDTAQAVAWQRGQKWPYPTSPWMSHYYLSATDTLPEYVLLERAMAGKVGPIPMTFDPRALGRPYLDRSDLVVLQIIKDEVGRRPIYFSTSTGTFPDQLGLTPYLVEEGLVRRLEAAPVATSDSIKAVRGGGLVNVPRTRTLAFDVYEGGRAASRRRPRGWVDVPSQNSLFGYAFMYDTLEAVLKAAAPTLAARAAQMRDAILSNTTYGRN
jgi:transmembrane protein TMEM260 (protein O-mannosyltransferase)